MPSLFSAARLRFHASFRHLAGVSVATFDQMLEQLRGPWGAAQRAKPKSGRPWEVGGLEDHLLILLIYYRCYVTQEFIGFFYGVDRNVICRAIKRVEVHAGVGSARLSAFSGVRHTSGSPGIALLTRMAAALPR